MRPYSFIKTVHDEFKTDVLLIQWNYEQGGVVLELSYTSNATEEEVYKKFVRAMDKAVIDGVLPLQLAEYNWYSWVAIQNGSGSRQYSLIRYPNNEITIFWKSTFVKNFFADKLDPAVSA